MSEEKTILLIDASNLIFRMYFALERTAMTSPDGRPSWAIFGFFKALLDILEKQQPTALIAAFDTKGPTFRHKAEESYKANRPKEMPEDLAAQWPEIKRGMELIGLNLVEMAGFEADDLIGTLACQAQKANWKVLIFSGDKDNFQLVNDQVKVLMPSNTGIQEITTTEVKAKMGVFPEQVVDYKALRGDAGDNISGVAGIGEKTAIKLLEEFNSLENIFKNLNNIKPDSVRRKLEEGKLAAERSRFLAEIKQDCEISYPFENPVHKIQPNIPELTKFLREYKLNSLEKRLPQIFKTFSDLEFTQEKLFAPEPVQEEQKSNLKIDYQTILTETALHEFFSKAQNAKHLALDLETDGLNTFTCQIVGVSLAYRENSHQELKSAYIPLAHNYLGSPEQLSQSLVLETIKNFLANWTGQLFVQNLKFEYKILFRHGLVLPASALDTMLASYLHNPDESHGLKNLALQVFNFAMKPIDALIGPKGKNQKTMNQIAVEEVSKYACDDSALTLALGEHYLNTLPENLNKLWKEIESPLAFLIAEIELTGVYINAQKLKHLASLLREQIANYEENITKELDLNQLNLNSSQQLGQALKAKGFTLSKATSSGQLSTDNKTLQELAKQDSTGLIKNIIEHRMLSKLHSTYTDSLVGQINPLTSRLHCEFNQALTSTGRLSSSNPNLQNIPVKNQEFGKLIRASFSAENENNILISADYSQIELRVLAHYTGDPTLLDAFNKHQDIHQRTAAEIFKVSPSDISPEMRRLGKTLNFALIYQQGVYATAQQLGISNKKASEFIERYFEAFPLVRPFMEETLNKAREKGFVETLWGRRRYFKNLNSSAAILRKAEERAAFNAPLQGSAADMMKIAMLRVSERLKKDNLQAKIILQVHDEIVLELPKEQKTLIEQILLDEMPLNNLPNPLKVPIEVQIAFGNNWAECK